jgi:hypothetical protein
MLGATLQGAPPLLAQRATALAPWSSLVPRLPRSLAPQVWPVALPSPGHSLLVRSAAEERPFLRGEPLPSPTTGLPTPEEAHVCPMQQFTHHRDLSLTTNESRGLDGYMVPGGAAGGPKPGKVTRQARDNQLEEADRLLEVLELILSQFLQANAIRKRLRDEVALRL